MIRGIGQSKKNARGIYGRNFQTSSLVIKNRLFRWCFVDLHRMKIAWVHFTSSWRIAKMICNLAQHNSILLPDYRASTPHLEQVSPLHYLRMFLYPVSLNPDSTRPVPTDAAAPVGTRGYRETPYSTVHSPHKRDCMLCVKQVISSNGTKRRSLLLCFLLIASSDAEHDHGHGMKIELEAQ